MAFKVFQYFVSQWNLYQHITTSLLFSQLFQFSLIWKCVSVKHVTFKQDSRVPVCIFLCPISWVHYSILFCIHIFKKWFFHLPGWCSSLKCNKLYFIPFTFVTYRADVSKSALYSSWFRMHLFCSCFFLFSGLIVIPQWFTFLITYFLFKGVFPTGFNNFYPLCIHLYFLFLGIYNIF